MEPEQKKTDTTQNTKLDNIIQQLQEKAGQGDGDACCRLANIYVAHSQNIKDYVKAYQFAKKAYKAGNLEAAFLLGEMNQFGTGCEKNGIRARYYYRKLLRQPDLQSRLAESTIIDIYCNLAKLYMSGKHKFCGGMKARKYYQKAYEMGCQEAQDELTEIAEHMGEYRRDAVGRVAFCLCLVLVGAWAYRTVMDNCRPLYQHVYDSVITDAVRVADGTSEQDTQQEAFDTDAGDTTAAAPGAAHYQVVSASELEENVAMTFTQVSVTSASATSEIKNDVGANYVIANTIDGKKYTNWQENANDDGIGQSLIYEFSREEAVYAIAFYNGNTRNEKAYRSHNRLQDIEIIGNGAQQSQNVVLEDMMEEQCIVFDQPILAQQIKITIHSIYPADGNHETCLSEIRFFTQTTTP